jgi:hypothetical protein
MSATTVIILVVLAALVVIAVFLSRGRDAAEPVDLAAEINAAESEAQMLLDPGPYQEQITALEELLSSQGSLDLTAVEHISYAAGRLASAVRDTVGGVDGARIGRQILVYAEEIKRRDASGFSTLDLPSARTNWIQLRNRLFSKANWMDGVSDSDRRMVVRRADANKPAYAVGLRQFGDRLADLVSDGRSEVGWIRGRAVDIDEGSPEAALLRDQWAEWTKEWDRRVDTMAAAMPSPPAVGGPESVTVAYTALARAVQDLRLISMSAGDFSAATIDSCEQQFDDAADQLTKARINLQGIE